jgi:hypothetical protein
MLRIEEGKPWVMWPNLLVANFIDDPANKVFDYDGDYEFLLSFKLPKEIKNKSTLFSKLPSYFGVDLYKDGLTLIITDITNKSTYTPIQYNWEIDKKYDLKIIKSGDTLELFLNDISCLVINLENQLAKDDLSHIIFAAGNFPKNGFNLNYLALEIEYLSIKKDGDLIAEHLFDTFIHNKSYDKTGNCNFIHLI